MIIYASLIIHKSLLRALVIDMCAVQLKPSGTSVSGIAILHI